MSTINQAKESAEADTPLLFFKCVLPSGDTEYWSSYSIDFQRRNVCSSDTATQSVRASALGG